MTAIRGLTRAVGSAARVGAAQFSPRHRQWRRLLAGLTVDPDALPQPLEAPGPADFIICGSPRSGTTLLCAALFQPPAAVTVMEPWDGMRMPPAALFRSLRVELDTHGTLSRGKLDVARLRQDGSVDWTDGPASFPVAVGADYRLGVKWPAFWRYLDLLETTKFLVCVRDPYEVISSYRSTGGRLARGLEYDIPFHRRMNAELARVTDAPEQRRILLHDYIVDRLAPHLSRPNVFVVRYERWFADPDALIAEIGAFLGIGLDRGQLRIRPRPDRPADPAERALIRERCRTASALGYRLGVS